MALPEFLTDPVPMAILTLLIAAIVHYQRGLTWTEYREIHRLKRQAFPLLDRYWDRFVHRKGGRGDAEFLRTCDQSVPAVFKQLVAEGGSPHVVASLKRRPTRGMEPYEPFVHLSAAHVVWSHDDGTQSEAYLFDNNDGSTDVYSHHETGVTDAEGHLSDPQTDGDPRGVVRRALGMGVV